MDKLRYYFKPDIDDFTIGCIYYHVMGSDWFECITIAVGRDPVVKGLVNTQPARARERLNTHPSDARMRFLVEQDLMDLGFEQQDDTKWLKGDPIKHKSFHRLFTSGESPIGRKNITIERIEKFDDKPPLTSIVYEGWCKTKVELKRIIQRDENVLSRKNLGRGATDPTK